MNSRYLPPWKPIRYFYSEFCWKRIMDKVYSWYYKYTFEQVYYNKYET